MRPNTPGEVSILIGVPLAERHFHEWTRTSDWLGRFSEPEAAQDYWRNVYLPFVVKPIQELVEMAQPLGSRVADGNLREVARASTQSRIVVLMAHWKDSKIEFDDLTPDVAGPAWRERSLRHSSPMARWLATRLAKKGDSSIVEILEESLKVELPEDGKSPHQVTEIRESVTSRAAGRRQELDSIFEGMMRPGNRLELLDGLHSKESFETAVAPGFDGVLDFAACTSTILADYVARRRRHRLRTVQATGPIEFVGSAPVIAGTLALLASGNFSYQEARTHARALWEGAVCAV